MVPRVADDRGLLASVHGPRLKAMQWGLHERRVNDRGLGKRGPGERVQS